MLTEQPSGHERALALYRKYADRINPAYRVPEGELAAALEALRFRAPLRTDADLLELLKVVKLHQSLSTIDDPLAAPGPTRLHLAVSITERCGHGCRHCSTDASLARTKRSVPLAVVARVLEEARPSIALVALDCEGDPFYYNDRGSTLIDIVHALADTGVQYLSLLHTPPMDDTYPRFREFLAAVAATGLQLRPELSFNLYHPYATKNRDVFSANFKRALTDYLTRGHDPVIHTRSDTYNAATNHEQTMEALRALLDELAGSDPRLADRRCAQCGRLMISIQPARTLPLGRARQLFPKKAIDNLALCDHRKRADASAYLCPNWSDWSTIYANTAGHLQLCYSTITLTQEVRNRSGPNLWKDPFDEVMAFMRKYWSMRAAYLKKHLPRIVKRRPCPFYCPQFVFDRCAQEYSL